MEYLLCPGNCQVLHHILSSTHLYYLCWIDEGTEAGRNSGTSKVRELVNGSRINIQA